MNDLFGKVAKCERGKLGVITGKARLNEYEPSGKLNELILVPKDVYLGTSFDGSKWFSIKPETLANNLNEFLSDRDGY